MRIKDELSNVCNVYIIKVWKALIAIKNITLDNKHYSRINKGKKVNNKCIMNNDSGLWVYGSFWRAMIKCLIVSIWDEMSEFLSVWLSI